MTEKRNGNFSVAAELVLSAAIGVGRPGTARMVTQRLALLIR